MLIVFTSAEITRIGRLEELQNLRYLLSITYMDVHKGYFMTSLFYLLELVLRQIIQLLIMYLYVLHQERKFFNSDRGEESFSKKIQKTVGYN